ncbi:hypothetical protein D1614_24565 [Maribellus luteus]|uniref:Uncharacterized protein n=1 Tax=Maribellus luteus TaxID=2305463 RepID=A0A399SNZ1_9BACT|nr:hypothetical protein D1614_24565 [Maribellus luteus]
MVAGGNSDEGDGARALRRVASGFDGGKTVCQRFCCVAALKVGEAPHRRLNEAQSLQLSAAVMETPLVSGYTAATDEPHSGRLHFPRSPLCTYGGRYGFF